MYSKRDCVSRLSRSGDGCPQSGYDLDFNMKPFSALQISMKLWEQSVAPSARSHKHLPCIFSP